MADDKALTVTVAKTPERKRLDREAKLQDRTFAEIQDRLVVDQKGNVTPAPPGPSIFDV